MRRSAIISRVALAAAVPSLALSVAILEAAPPARAEAAPTLVTSEALASGEALAIAGPATLVAKVSGGAGAVASFVNGEQPSTVAAIPAHYRGVYGAVLTGSATRIALLESGVEAEGYKGNDSLFSLVETGPIGGELSEPEGKCELAPSLDDSVEQGLKADSTIALSGEVLAYDSYGCVVAYDFATGTERIIPLESTLDPLYRGVVASLPSAALLRVAGPLVAYRANPLGDTGQASVVVYDLATEEQLYSVRLPTFLTYYRAPTFALEEDGTLLVADPGSCTATVSTVAEPAPRPLGIPACEADGLQAGRALILAPGEGADRRLAWTPLQTPAAHEIADLGEHDLLTASAPVLGGDEVAYALRGCSQPTVYRATLAKPGAPPAPPRSCPARVPTGRAVLGRRRLRVTVSCPRGCNGDFFASTGTRKEIASSRFGELLIRNSAYTLAIAPASSKTFLLPYRGGPARPRRGSLVPRLRAALRAGRPEYLELNLETEDPTARQFGENTRSHETRTTAIVPIRLANSMGRAPRTSMLAWRTARLVPSS